jgi:hypothetical protein
VGKEEERGIQPHTVRFSHQEGSNKPANTDRRSGGAERKTPPGKKDTYIMWEAAEKILHGIESDVLVILDCCDAGYLHARGTSPSFDYLVACAESKKTHGPGDNSFTSALIWALKELKLDAPFSTEELKDKIRSYQHFPNRQEPVVFSRWKHITEPICLAPIESDILSTRLRGSSAVSPLRSEECSYVELRFFFDKALTVDDAKQITVLASPAVQDRKLNLKARHVEFIKKGGVNALNNWRRSFNMMRLIHTRKKRPADEDDDDDNCTPLSPKRIRFESGMHTLKALGVVSGPQPLISPISEDQSSEADSQMHSHGDSQPAKVVDLRLSILKQPQVSSEVVGSLMLELDSLEQNLVQKKGLAGLPAKIRAINELLKTTGN